MEEETEDREEVDKKNSLENKSIRAENCALKEQITSLEAKVVNQVKMILHLNNDQYSFKKEVHNLEAEKVLKEEQIAEREKLVKQLKSL